MVAEQDSGVTAKKSNFTKSYKGGEWKGNDTWKKTMLLILIYFTF